MKLSTINEYIGSWASNFLEPSWESSWKGDIAQILCNPPNIYDFVYGFTRGFINGIASSFMKTNEPASQDFPSLRGRVAPKAPVEQDLSLITYQDQSIPGVPNEIMELFFQLLNAEELAKIAPVCKHWNAVFSSDNLSNKIAFPSWLEDVSHVWERVNLKKYGLDVTGVPRINRRALTKALKPLSGRVENNMGITNMVIPKELTLKIILQIAKDYLVPVLFIWSQISVTFGDIPAEQTCVKFFTNSILKGTRSHDPEQHAADVVTIRKECRVAIHMLEVRDFMAFLVLTYLNSPEDARIKLYSSATYTRLLEKINNCSLYGGFAPAGLDASINYVFGSDDIGVGASGSSEDIGTGNIGT